MSDKDIIEREKVAKAFDDAYRKVCADAASKGYPAISSSAFGMGWRECEQFYLAALAAELERKRECERMVEEAWKIELDNGQTLFGDAILNQWNLYAASHAPLGERKVIAVGSTAVEAYKAATDARTDGEGAHRDYEAEVQRFACPRCGVLPGQRCTFPKGKERTPHGERWVEWRNSEANV